MTKKYRIIYAEKEKVMKDNLVLHNVALPIRPNASGGEWIDALDYYPSYKRFGGQYEWGAYVSWLLKYAGEDGFSQAMQLLTPNVFLERYIRVKENV